MAQVRDIMEKNVITIPLEKTALDAARILKEKKISFLVIVQEDKPLGIVTERDIVRKIAAEDKNASSTKLEEIMSVNFKWVEPSTTVDAAVQKMVNSNIRRLVVLENEKLVGVITQTDLAGFLRSKLLINGTVESLDKN
ncbi:MAG: CBS domain-containing protein [Nitrosopumilaceae archaeon]|nr:CBS domain-containing protein [Nitrosopumilaceae archaeon]